MGAIMARNKSGASEFVDPKIQRLRDVSGHNGPWTSAEYVAAMGGPVAPSREPAPTPTVEVVEAREKTGEAQAAFDEAHADWAASRLAVGSAKAKLGPTRVTRDGQLIEDRDTPRKVRRLDGKADDAWKTRERAAERLREVRAEQQAVEAAWRYRLLADAYDANKK